LSSKSGSASRMPYAYVISHGDFKIYIALADIAELHLHEELVPELLDGLVDAIPRDGVLRHPIIVDRDTLVVLDGMHRVGALERLGYERIPVCLVDYLSPLITVGCWYRTLRDDVSLSRLLAEAQALELDVEHISHIAPKEVGVPPVAAAVLTADGGFVVKKAFESLDAAYAVVKLLEERIRALGVEIGFETEDDSMRMLRSGEVGGVLMTPRVEKEDVLRVALAGRLFPHKTTRHVIPARPLFVNVPLDLLKGDIALEEASARLAQLLKKRRLRHVPPGHLIEGRRYEEDLYIFE